MGGHDEREHEDIGHEGKVSSSSNRKSNHRRSDSGHGKRNNTHSNGELDTEDIQEASDRDDKQKGRSLSSRANRKAHPQVQVRMEHAGDGTAVTSERVDKCEEASASCHYQQSSTVAAVPVGIAAWNEIALGGEAEGGNVLSQLLAIGYYVDTVHTIQSHSFLVPCFVRAAGRNSDSSGPGVDRPVHAAGGSVLVVIERCTLLGGLGCSTAKSTSSATYSESNTQTELEPGEHAAVTVRIEGTDPVEVARVGRLIALGTLAAKKLRGVDATNVSALNGFVDSSNRPASASAHLPWLNPWRDNDTQNDSRPASGASTHSQQHGDHQSGQRSSRPASASSTNVITRQHSVGGGYGAGGLVALPVNRSSDINRSQRRVRSRAGSPPGGKHGEYWKTTDTPKKQAHSVAGSGSGMAAVAAAQHPHTGLDTAQDSSSEEDDFDG